MVKLKSISEKCIFHAQPNTRIYRKIFPETIFTQNKCSLSVNGTPYFIIVKHALSSKLPMILKWKSMLGTYVHATPFLIFPKILSISPTLGQILLLTSQLIGKLNYFV